MFARNDAGRDENVRTIASVDELAALVGDRTDLYLRWSAGPSADRDGRSQDALTGVDLPGLSANTLAVEPWWGDRSRSVWIARRLYDYQHLRHERGDDAWVLTGRECGRGPDNEPLLDAVEVVAKVAPSVAEEARQTIETLNGDWGTLDRNGANSGRSAAHG